MKKSIIIAAAMATIASVGHASAFENVDFTKAAEETVNSVVSVKSFAARRQVQQSQMAPFFNDPFFEFFFGPHARGQQRSKPEQKQPEMKQTGLGSGVIIDSDGYIVTNNHVIDNADKLEITLNDNRSFEAQVIGSDPMTDLALLKIEAPDLHAIIIGESDSLKVGQWVLAVGNPFGLTSTVTAGIVSAKARSISTATGMQSHGIESYIQTDAAVNPGNSGGALVNLKGELVGINSAIYSQTGNYAGNSFAIPTSIVRKVVDDLRQYGSVQRAVMGLRYGELTQETAREYGITATSNGLFIGEVIDGSAADEAGIKKGDVIVAVNGHRTPGSGDLQEVMARLRPGDTAVVTVVRDNKLQDFSVTMRNNKGDTAIVKQGDFTELGCTFESLKPEELEELGIKSGLRVKEIKDGKFKRVGMRDGFIIVDINNVYVTKADDVRKLYDSIVSSDEYDHVMFISGIYPISKKKTYFAVDLAD